jgi:lactoylglutathione lyase
VSDFERAISFYCEGLGFHIAERYDLDAGAMPDLLHSLEMDDAGKVTSQMIVNGPMKLEILHYPGRPAQGTPSTSRGLLGLTHLSFIVDDVDAAAARLVEHGGTILAHTRVDVGIPLVFLTDPDGTRIELMAEGA